MEGIYFLPKMRPDFPISVEVFRHWDKEVTNFLNESKVEYLILNRDYSEDTLDFLLELKHLRSLRIDGWMGKDVSALAGLENLEYLHLSGLYKTGCDFSKLKNLKQLIYYWKKGKDSESLFECKSLEELNLYEYKEQSINKISQLKELKKLKLVKASKLDSLEGIAGLTKLEYAQIAYNPKLENIDELSSLASLESLEIQNCKKIKNLIEVISNIKQLKLLEIQNMDNIATLRPLEKCKNLENLQFYGIDLSEGDLSFLDSMSSLKFVNFQNKKHYSLQREYFHKKLKMYKKE